MRARACLLVLLGLSAGIASGQSATDPLERCAAEKDDAARLACFDRQMALRHGNHSAGAPPGAAQPVPAAPPPAVKSAPQPDRPQGHAATAQPQTAAPAASAASQSAQAPDPNMGLQGAALRKKLKEERKEQPRPVRATVARLVPLAHSEYAFELDNGQIWQETDSRGGVTLKVNDPVTISPGIFGDFFFTTSTHVRIRVKRIDDGSRPAAASGIGDAPVGAASLPADRSAMPADPSGIR